MQRIVFYRHEKDGEAFYEYNFYDHQFAPTNLVVRKILMAMLESVREQLTHLEVEYNDKMLADKLGKRAGELLRFLGAARENLQENRSGDVVVSRQFRAELTPERYDYFYQMKDVSELSHYRLLAGERERIVFYFNRYLLLQLPIGDEERFYAALTERQVPYKIEAVSPPI
ncbi:hypothetical protein G3578_19240 [Brevibacillus sp. SYP-B805]|uniref:hypothetical protein n=1 Tax=Brevibacillus sp. SYP-B805 TaxID=1578199 RepID=UPI0013EBBE13|nr:hypothetical protein [Brevibacillus sp. SYP-B805]NGQ97277.1 hypothetical protein [Brevibacillus sp. SYP-B805]